jgi:hypothetical protein
MPVALVALLINAGTGLLTAPALVKTPPAASLDSPRLLQSPYMLAKSARKKGSLRKTSSPTKISPRGFGATSTKGGGRLLEEPKYTALYEWLNTSPLTNLKKVGVADFGGLRGVMALQDISPGEEIVAIPATFAVDLGLEALEPYPAARRLLTIKSQELASDADRAVYWDTLPPPDSPDMCTPDFFKEKEMQMLQWPPLVQETRKRSAEIRKLLGDSAPSTDTPVGQLSAAGGAIKEFRWAVWLVLSRVLTVVGPGAEGAQGYKLMIPFIDMFNHKAGTKHYLTGRTDGMLRVVAGSPVKAGEQIFIMYGTEGTSNVEFVAHYGFHDPSSTAAAADAVVVSQAPKMIPALSHTTIEEDEALLAANPPYQEQLALKLRLSLKRAAVKAGLLDGV